MQDMSAMPSECPPAAAQPVTGIFYRLTAKNLVLGEAPGNQDWILPVNKRKGDCAGSVDVCGCWAHSVFADVDDLLEAAKTSNWVRGKSIASVGITPEMGRLAKTPSEHGDSHHDWWPSADIDVSTSVVVREAQ